MVVFMYGTAIEYNGVQLCFLMEYTQSVLLLLPVSHRIVNPLLQLRRLTRPA